MRQRLKHLYGDAGIISYGERPGGGFQASVQIPLRRPDESFRPVPGGADPSV
jgi:hypothetical protein